MSLRERKQQRAREEIIEAAFDLFAERGYANVTVADIAERAEVGRTTFFRYFGDKQEVVFAGEQDWLDDVTTRHRAHEHTGPPTLTEAIAMLRDTVAAICASATRNPGHYLRREQLIAENPELEDRSARKQRLFTSAITEILREQGASASTSALAPQIALACYTAGRLIAAGDPALLGPSVDAAFEQLFR
ncbi:TetR/AcrR family transcriptional regulator [Pseudonocardia yunnanensis]|uniref:TetR/AcrR family transcriptional regulator n=1 Tax=Pseudonocardia yunnanensis TaxID=58107 RepID=A0ABW4EL28_9PSEU